MSFSMSLTPTKPTSMPFIIMMCQFLGELDHTVQLCEEIRRTRHIGTTHTQLDGLESSLAEGANFIRSNALRVTERVGADIYGGDGTCFPFEIE